MNKRVCTAEQRRAVGDEIAIIHLNNIIEVRSNLSISMHSTLMEAAAIPPPIELTASAPLFAWLDRKTRPPTMAFTTVVNFISFDYFAATTTTKLIELCDQRDATCAGDIKVRINDY